MLRRTSNLRNSAEPKINLAANFSLAEGNALHPAVFFISPGASSPKGYRSIFVFSKDHLKSIYIDSQD